jgi:exocyst complex component 4
MFKLQDMDTKSSDLTTEKEDLQTILTTSVPGLVSDSKKFGVSDQASSTNAPDGSATGHRLLVTPNVFNMAILLPPSLTFLTRLKEVVPSSSDITMNILTSFLDDFLINVFLPQLDETVAEMCSQVFIEIDAFQQDPSWQTHANKPIFKGAAKFYRLLEAFCDMLDILPHDQAFTQLIINQIVTYYDKCYGWYKGKFTPSPSRKSCLIKLAMVARTSPHPKSGKRLKLAADLVEEVEFKGIVNTIMNAKSTDVDACLESVSFGSF